MDFTPWVAHFQRNVPVQSALEAQVDRAPRAGLDARRRRAFVRSFQRFELGESGDGRHLLAKAERAGDPQYTRALALFVAEEQRHSGLFARGLDHLGGAPLAAHWSNTAFTMLRRALGLRTELGLFLVAESVAVEYFAALASGAPDPVLRAIGRRLEHDERDHLRFQVDGLAVAYAGRPALLRWAVRLTLLGVGLLAVAVLATDHRAALRACGRRPTGYAWQAVGHLRHHVDLALSGRVLALGPSRSRPPSPRDRADLPDAAHPPGQLRGVRNVCAVDYASAAGRAGRAVSRCRRRGPA